MTDEVDFLHADKHESFLQIDTMIFNADGQVLNIAKYFQNSNLQYLCNISKRVRDEVDFFGYR